MIMSCHTRAFQFVSIYWKAILVVFTPIIFLPIVLLNEGLEFRCMYIVAIMAVLWCTEALPLPITSMIPIAAFPLLGILDTDKTCQMYFKETVVMFVGGIIIALAVEYCQLHTRIALNIMKYIGCSQRKLNFGLTAVTMFISMWISNTATIAMMAPISMAILKQLEEQGLCRMNEIEDYDNLSAEQLELRKAEPPRPSNITLCWLIGAAYAASIGGTGTLVGTGTNLTFKGIFETSFPDAPGIDFPRWMFYNVPGMLISQFLTWLWLQCLFMGMFRPNSKEAKAASLGAEGERVAGGVINEKLKDLGSITSHEISVAILFIVAVLGWFFRKPGFITGWSQLVTDLPVKDATPAILVSILLFILPSKWNFLKFFRTTDKKMLPRSNSPALISWKFVNEKFPWSLLFLLGGGFALAEGGRVSGMSKMIGNSLSGLNSFPPLAILFFVCLACQLLTELTSNVAIANLILPVVAEMSKVIEINPMYLMIPATITCSFAFHMPVGTPPNAFAAGLANIRTKSWFLAGFGPTIITLLVVWITFPTWGSVVYPDLLSFPDWAKNNASRIVH